MNFLAHFLLAKPTSASRCGNFLGDFVKGTPESLKPRYSPALIEGIVMHRAVDRFTDTHPHFAEGRALLAPSRRRFAGIVLDLFTDHFLAKHWAQFHPLTLSAYSSLLAEELRLHDEEMPERARTVSKRLFREEWFEHYSSRVGIGAVLGAVSQRSVAFHPLAQATCDLDKHYRKYEHLSLSLLKEAQTFARQF